MSSYQENQFAKIAQSIRVMQGGTTDEFTALDFANQIRNIDRDSLPYKSTIALEDNSVVVQDSLDDELDEMVVYGASEQTVTEQGKQLLRGAGFSSARDAVNPDGTDFWTVLNEEATPLSDGWMHIEHDNTSGVDSFYIDMVPSLNSVVGFKAGVTFCIVVEIKNVSDDTTSGISFSVSNTNANDPFGIVTQVAVTEGNVVNAIRTVKSNYTGDVSARCYQGIGVGKKACYDVRVSFYPEGTTDYTYEPFIPDSPSPDYPSEIRNVSGEVTVQGKNLFVEEGLSTPSSNSAFWRVLGTSMCTQLEEGWMHIDCDNLDGNSTEYVDFWTQIAAWDVQPSKNYKLSVELRNVDSVGITWFSFGNTSSSSDESSIFNNRLILNVEEEAQTIYSVSTKPSFSDITIGSRDFLSVSAGKSITCDIRMMLVPETVTDYTYQPYYPPTTMNIPTLYGIGDVKDVMYVDRATERAWVERKMKRVEVNSDLPMRLFYDQADPDLTRCYIQSAPQGLAQYVNIYTKMTRFSNYGKKCDGAFSTDSSGNYYFYLDESRLTEISDSGVAQWCAENPTTIVAPLATPTIEELDYTALPTFAEGTTVMITPSDDSPSPVVAEVTLRTTSEY